MKKAILIPFLLITAIAFSQDTTKKAVAIPKPQFQIDPNKAYQLPPMSFDDLQKILMSPDDFRDLERSEKVPGSQIHQIEQTADYLRKKMLDYLNHLVGEDYKNWQDTVGKPKPPIKK